MSEAAASRPIETGRVRDLAALGKLRLSLLVIFTSASGLWLAPVRPEPPRAAAFLLATFLLVAAANAINSWMERDVDARMLRTRDRPLPAGRMEPSTAAFLGISVSLASLVWLYFAANPLTAALGAAALAVYVLVYTPLKRVTPWAVVVGAVPGAIPPLMGWTAATGSLAAPGWYLFGILFLWQLPHFVAIAIHLKDDYRRGGIRALPVVRGEPAARRHLSVHALLLVAYSLGAARLGLAGPAYTIVAAALGAPLLAWAWGGLRRSVGPAWARRLFAYTLVYLPLLVAALALDAR